jgi:hypothetical protein
MINNHDFECVIRNTHDFEITKNNTHNFEVTKINTHNFEVTMDGFNTSTTSRVLFVMATNIEIVPSIAKRSSAEFSHVTDWEITSSMEIAPSVEFAQASGWEIDPTQAIAHDGWEWQSQTGWEMILSQTIRVDSGGEYAMTSGWEFSMDVRNYFLLNNFSGSLLSDLDALLLDAMDYVAI